MFEVGDKVVGMTEHMYAIGEIIDIDNSLLYPYLVKFHNTDLGEEWLDYGHLLAMNASDPVDPKQPQGAKKLGFSHIPTTAYCLLSAATKNGADKYGPHNWLELPDGNMSLMTYIDAIQRHLLLYKAGQDVASDSGIHHLDHIMAGVAVVRDAMLFGKVADDRNSLSEEQIEVLENLISNDKSM